MILSSGPSQRKLVLMESIRVWARGDGASAAAMTAARVAQRIRWRMKALADRGSPLWRVGALIARWAGAADRNGTLRKPKRRTGDGAAGWPVGRLRPCSRHARQPGSFTSRSPSCYRRVCWPFDIMGPDAYGPAPLLQVRTGGGGSTAAASGRT